MNLRFAFACTSGLLLCACTSINATQATFAGTRWHVTAINGHPTPAAEHDRYYIEFGPVGFSGRMGCNTMQGGYLVTAGTIVPGMTAATQVGCYTDAPNVIQPMTYERWAFDVLRRPMRMHWNSGKRLTLSNAAGSIALERAP